MSYMQQLSHTATAFFVETKSLPRLTRGNLPD